MIYFFLYWFCSSFVLYHGLLAALSVGKPRRDCVFDAALMSIFFGMFLWWLVPLNWRSIFRS